MKFEIEGELPTMNEIVKVAKAHYGAYSSMKKKHTQKVSHAARKIEPMKRANFRITWYCKDKRKDKDNISSGTKFILDGVVEAGILTNDGWKEIGDVTHKFEVDKKNPRIVVEMFEF